MKKILNRYTRELAKNYEDIEKKYKKEIAQFYEKYGDSVEDEIYKYNREKKFKAKIEKELKELSKANVKVIRSGLKKSVTEAMADTKRDLLKYNLSKDDKRTIKGIKFNIDVTEIVNSNTKGLNWAEREAYNREYAIKKIQETLIGGFETGQRYEEMARELSRQLNISYNKSHTILATEWKRCTSTTKVQGLEELGNKGIKIKKKWLSSQDERVRSSHSELDGQVVDVNEKFRIRGYEADGPGLFGVAEEDINCRCEVVGVYDDD